MPTYEYQCLSCGRHTEAVQRFSDEPLRTCPHCGGPLRRVFHPVGIVLKGSGFYSTDNRGGSKHRAAESKEPKKETSSDSAETTGASDSSSKSDKTTKKGSDSTSSTAKPKKE
jgi:putative FmdB family regulatory protein